MTSLAENRSRPLGYHVDAPAENLLFTVFRYWMAGYSTGDAACWDLAWDALAGEMPPEAAKPLYGEFHHFVRCLRGCASADIVSRPIACNALCRDECLVLAMIEAAQREDGDQLVTAAANLLGHDSFAPALAATVDLAKALARAGFMIAPVHPAALGEVLRASATSVVTH